MKVIRKASDRVQKSWGKGKVITADYRLMQYVLTESVDQSLLLHNVVTGELVQLDASEAAHVSALPAPYQEWMTELIEKHFLVPQDFDEYRSVQQLRRLMKAMHKVKGITGYTILPTTNCNARCFYCYEANCAKVNMSTDTAEAAVRFIKDHNSGKKVSILWFGGEPLVGMKQIDQITQGLVDAGVEYSSSMISNGYLFSRSVADKAKDFWKLTFVQITLDGTEEVYNQVKSYVGVSGSPYQTVLNNIELLLQRDIFVSVRMNLDYHNAEDLSALIDALKARFSGYKNFNAYVYVLFDDEGYSPVRHTAEDKLYLEQKRYELNARLTDWVAPGRSGMLPSLQFSACMADNDGSAIIYPDGTLAKCEHYMDENLGNVHDGFTDKKRIQEWKAAFELDKCKACVLYPKCIKLRSCPSCSECFESSVQIDLDNYRKAMRRALEDNVIEADSEPQSGCP